MSQPNGFSNDGPCPCPPHPDVLAHIKANGGTSGRISKPETHTLGINDGCIYPPESYPPEASIDTISNAALERAPLRGSIRVAVVLVDFADQPMAVGAVGRFRDLFFSVGKIPTGSVTEYYKDVSGGLISMTGEVIGPYRMPRRMREYAHGASGFRNNVPAPNTQTLGADALRAATGHINFAPYDNDGNGYVDAFVVVHAGRGAEQDNDVNKIWSVKWNIPTQTTVNGVKVYTFLTIPEDANIGVACHELGHLVFGWPDLYDTDYTSEGVGNWCLMAGGSWGGSPAGTRPCHPSAWCKASQGWVSVVNETSNHPLVLHDVKSGRRVHRLWRNGDAASKEYFLIENRQQAGFDQYLPGGGLLVWHIDDNVPNNTNERHYRVALMQADGLNQLATSTAGRGDTGDPFPGSKRNTSFTAATNPNSHDYTNRDSQVTITRISDSKEAMTMDVAVLPVHRVGTPPAAPARL